MEKLIEIKCINNNCTENYPLGTTLKDISKNLDLNFEHPPLGALVNNKLEEMNYSIFRPKIVNFIDITHIDGLRMYVRSLTFVLQKAIKELFVGCSLSLEYSISKGYYCEINGLEEELSFDLLFTINDRMRELIDKDIPFVRKEILKEDAIKIFDENGHPEKAKLFRTIPDLYKSVYYLNGLVDYFYGYLVPSTGYLKVFDLIKYNEGMLLMVPDRNNPSEVRELIKQKKLFGIFREHKEWGKILGVSTIGSVNKKVLSGNAGELIKISEALHEKKVAAIADEIANKTPLPRIVLISGPSSSGKTTFAKRLSIQLKVNRIHTCAISLDNYFVDRDKTPKDKNGEYDFEALEAVDIKLFNNNLLRLLDGDTVEIPKFSFEKGKRYYDNSFVTLDKDQIILIEGIHALNPELTQQIDDKIKFKIYVSVLTQMGIDSYNRIPTTDNRLLRRIIRDYQYRNYSAYETIKRWTSVRKGEERHIFPFQENADVMFNSALTFELGVLKRFVEPLLREIYQNTEVYAEAQRLLKFLSYVKPIQDKEIPPTSLLREFLFKSSFKY